MLRHESRVVLSIVVLSVIAMTARVMGMTQRDDCENKGFLTESRFGRLCSSDSGTVRSQRHKPCR